LSNCDVRYGGYTARAALEFQTPTPRSTTNRHPPAPITGSTARARPRHLSNTRHRGLRDDRERADFTATPGAVEPRVLEQHNGYDAFGCGRHHLVRGLLPQRGPRRRESRHERDLRAARNLTVASSGSLTIAPGVVIKPAGSYSITVDGLSPWSHGGTGDSISITSIHDDNLGQPQTRTKTGSIVAPAAGLGRGSFQPGIQRVRRGCRLRFGSNAATQGNARDDERERAVTDCLLSDAAPRTQAQRISAPVITNVADQQLLVTPILMSVSRIPRSTDQLPPNALTAAGPSRAHRGRLAPPGAHYRRIREHHLPIQNGRITMQSPAILRIDPGVVVKDSTKGGITIDGALVADAKPRA